MIGTLCGWADTAAGTANGIALDAVKTGRSCLLTGDMGRAVVCGGGGGGGEVVSVFGGSQCRAVGA